MKSDVNGCSTCPRGEEQWEEFTSTLFDGPRVQYDYRTQEGRLFGCIAKSLEEARQKKDKWLKEIQLEKAKENLIFQGENNGNMAR